jgi:hypothetical protein
MVMTMEMKDKNSARKKTASVIIIWLLVASAVFIIFPLSEPKAGAILYHGNSAAWEDQDFGGGLDYNGDPAGDLKVTWHAANNSHIVNDNFIVSDGHILELEEGVVVQTDPGMVIQVGGSAPATFYANGTLANPVLMGPNSSGPWAGIYVVFGSYGYFDNTWIDQASIVWADQSTLDIRTSAITNMNMYGIYSSGSTVSVNGTFINNTNSPGIYALNSDLTVSYSLITNTPTAAIWSDSSTSLIEYSEIYGLNASAGANGGHALYVNGTSPSVTISNNFNIIGGKGGTNVGFVGGEGDLEYLTSITKGSSMLLIIKTFKVVREEIIPYRE